LPREKPRIADRAHCSAVSVTIAGAVPCLTPATSSNSVVTGPGQS
jgi:hypothetical protein